MDFTFNAFKKDPEVLPFISLPVPRGAYRKAVDFLQQHEVIEQGGMAFS